MSRVKKQLFFFPIAALLFSTACNIHMGPPPLDWESFDPAHIDNKLSKKGPLGDFAIIFWQNTKGTYTARRLSDYAYSKGWRTLADTILMDSIGTRFYDLFVNSIVDTLSGKMNKHVEFPAWFKQGGRMYKFYFLRKTNGKDSTYQSTVLVSRDESSACVYPIMDDS